MGEEKLDEAPLPSKIRREAIRDRCGTFVFGADKKIYYEGGVQ